MSGGNFFGGDFPILWVLLGLFAIVAIWFAATYNGLIRHVNFCNDSWADIDTELKRRYDLIPNLVETVRGYAKHEADLLARVTEARNKAAASHHSPREQAADENRLVGQLRQLVAVAESYPDLKANANFLALQGELVNTEDRIQRARRFYNANVRDLNTRIEVIPSNFVASMFGFQRREYFEIEEAAQREAVKVSV
ncbi:MAG: LemA family protein [Planctomycetes bacterium]|nr:LemA family protein [Planctomycetota bacterium]